MSDAPKLDWAERLRGTLAAFRFMLGFGGSQLVAPRSSDANTQLAHDRTELAVNRTYLASERTLMGWIRTALSMISFGFTIGKLGQAVEQVELKGMLGKLRTVSVQSLAYFLVILGTLALLAATVQHVRRSYNLIRTGLQPQFSIAVIVAVLLVLVGGFALSSLVLEV